MSHIRISNSLITIADETSAGLQLQIAECYDILRHSRNSFDMHILRVRRRVAGSVASVQSNLAKGRIADLSPVCDCEWIRSTLSPDPM